MENNDHKLCKSIISELIDIIKDNSNDYDEEFKDFARNELEEIKEEIDLMLLENF